MSSADGLMLMGWMLEKTNFVDMIITTQAPYQPQEKIIFIQAPCQDKTTASWSKYNVNNKRNIFIQAPHLDL